MRAILGLLLMVGIACLVLAAIMAIQATPLSAMDVFIVGVSIVIISIGLKG